MNNKLAKKIQFGRYNKRKYKEIRKKIINFNEEKYLNFNKNETTTRCTNRHKGRQIEGL